MTQEAPRSPPGGPQGPPKGLPGPPPDPPKGLQGPQNSLPDSPPGLHCGADLGSRTPQGTKNHQNRSYLGPMSCPFSARVNYHQHDFLNLP